MAMIKQSRNFTSKRAGGLPLERPRVVLVAVIWLYVIAALTFVGLASHDAIAAACCSFFIFSVAFALQRGFGWVRILLSAIIGLGWILLCLDNAISGLLIILIWGCPIILMWLPKSSAWYKNQSIERKYEAMRDEEKYYKNRGLVRISILAVVGLILCFVSGVGQQVVNDYSKNCDKLKNEFWRNGKLVPIEERRGMTWRDVPFPDIVWSAGFKGLIPGYGMPIICSFNDSINETEVPFWLTTCNLIFRLVGVLVIWLVVWLVGDKEGRSLIANVGRWKLSNEHR